MQPSWYSFRNAAEAVEISIYEEIGFFGVSAKGFLEELKAVGPRPITLRINSPGGNVFDGLAIYNRLREHAAGVTVKIDGIAASMASVIAMVGKRVEMADNALLMIHNPAGIVAGGADDMRDTAELLDKVKASLVTAYVRKTGLPEAKISKMMDAETYLTASEAESLGFVDAVTESLKLAARFDSGRLPNVPAHLAGFFKSHTNMNPILNVSILTLLAAATGLALNEKSPQEEIEKAITNLGQRNSQLEADLKTARESFSAKSTELDTLKGQFDVLTKSAKEATDAKAGLEADINAKAGEIKNLKDAAKRDGESIVRLEALCGVKGIDPKKAAPSLTAPEDSDAELYDRFVKADQLTATAMFNDPKTGPRIRAESQRRHAGN